MRRLREFDFIRAVAALSVIAIHVTGIYVYSSRAAYAWNQAMRYAVPLFIILSGFLLAYSEVGKKNLSYSEFIQKRFKKIVIPYLIWTTIYVLFNLRGHYKEAFSDIYQFGGSFMKNILFGTGDLHLYFVIIILQMYLLYPLLKMLLARWEGATLLFSFAITLYFQTGIYLQNIKVARILPRTWIPYYESFLPWLFFFVFGMVAVGRMEGWRERYLKGWGISGVIWGISFLVLISDSIFTQTNADSIKPTVMLYCMTSFFFFYTAALKLKDTSTRIGDILDWLSKQSFLIYLSHILILVLLKGAVRKIGLPGLWDGSIGMGLLFIANVVCTAIFVYVISFTPAASYLGGVPSGEANKLFGDSNKANMGA
ncbi:MAG: acyltransferase [Clostridia bacterium]|nr:acyltransferase [Clostridia bacterium]